MAPEQLNAPDLIGGHSDVFALGVTLFEWLTNEQLRPEWWERGLPWIMEAACQPTRVRDRAPWIPRRVAEVMDAALEPDVALRTGDRGAVRTTAARARTLEGSRVSPGCPPERTCILEVTRVGAGVAVLPPVGVGPYPEAVARSLTPMTTNGSTPPDPLPSWLEAELGSLHLLPSGERQAEVEALCRAHPEQAERVRRVLAKLEQLDGDIDTRAGEATDDAPERIGPYRILSVLGEGGMGTVQLAEQKEPVRRRVALKLIKRGMDSKQVLARFEAERQALAMMEHSAIAKVFDGGITDDGRPFFVMEYVRGEPITSYCDKQRLGIEERLGLFREVCDGRAARAPEGRDPPRPQADERAGRARGRALGAEDHRLRSRACDRPPPRRGHDLHRARADRRHTRVHVARAGRHGQSEHRHAPTSTRSASSCTSCSSASCRSRRRSSARPDCSR